MQLSVFAGSKQLSWQHWRRQRNSFHNLRQAILWLMTCVSPVMLLLAAGITSTDEKQRTDTHLYTAICHGQTTMK